MGPRKLDYTAQRGVIASERMHKDRQWEIESNFLDRMNKGKQNKEEISVSSVEIKGPKMILSTNIRKH
jgi:hypothetical protein